MSFLKFFFLKIRFWNVNIKFDRTCSISLLASIKTGKTGKIIVGSYSQIRKYAVIDFLGEITIENNCVIDQYARIEGSGKIYLGEFFYMHKFSMILPYGGSFSSGIKCTLNPFSIIYGHGGVKLGDAVRIATHSVIVSANHIYKDRNKQIREQGLSCKGIIISDDVWIGANVTILDGVTIQRGGVIAAGSVVNCNTDDFGIYAGVPVKKIKGR